MAIKLKHLSPIWFATESYSFMQGTPKCKIIAYMPIAYLKYLFLMIAPHEWSWVLSIRRLFLKIRDYDRLENDYSCVLCHATGSRMSYTDYELQTIYSVIDEHQSEWHTKMIKDDLQLLIDAGADIDEIKEAIANL